MPIRFVIFTKMKITRATNRNVVSAPMKCPIRNGPAVMVSHSIPGIDNSMIGMIKSSTKALTKFPRYNPRMKATAIPMTRYFERKSLNSFTNPFGGAGVGGAGFGSRSCLIFLNSSNTSSCFVDKLFPPELLKAS